MFDKKDLDKKVEEKLLIRQSHPTLPLSIYNYSQTTQYTGAWDEITLAARGLIVDDETGQAIIKPFPKFFNYEEVIEKVPWETSQHVHVQNKMDGSLGILFNYKGEWIMATRGSFTSDQAVRGMEILKSKYNLDAFAKYSAYLVEILYESNRIVVKYTEDKVVFLSAVPNLHHSDTIKFKEGASEFSLMTSRALFISAGIEEDDIVDGGVIYDGLGHSIYEGLKSMNTENEEGYVLRFYPSNFRCKIKFEDYTRLHRIVTQVSSYDVWEHLMKNGKLPEEFLTKVPDEFYNWVKKTSEVLQTNFNFLKSLHFAVVSSTLGDNGIERSQMAEEFMYQASKEPRLNPGVLFYIADGKNVDEKIWKMIKPEYQRPFQENR